MIQARLWERFSSIFFPRSVHRASTHLVSFRPSLPTSYITEPVSQQRLVDGLAKWRAGFGIWSVFLSRFLRRGSAVLPYVGVTILEFGSLSQKSAFR